jgi:hypothetical protein
MINKALKLVEKGYNSEQYFDLLCLTDPHKSLTAFTGNDFDPLKLESDVIICMNIYNKLITGIIVLIMTCFKGLYDKNKLTLFLDQSDVDYIGEVYTKTKEYAVGIMFNQKGITIIEKFCENFFNRFDDMKEKGDLDAADGIIIMKCNYILNKTKAWKKIPNWCMQLDSTENEIVWLG